MTTREKIVHSAAGLREFLDFFDSYVVSVKDRTGQEVFEETGGSDYNLENLRECLSLLESEIVSA